MTTFSTISRACLRHAKRRAGGPDAGRNRDAIERECVTETGAAAGTKAGEVVGLFTDSRAVAMSRPFGRKPYGRDAAARSAAPLPQVGGTRRNAAPMAA